MQIYSLELTDDIIALILGQGLTDGCPAGYIPTPCPSDIPGCFDERFICDLEWECSLGEDESSVLYSCPGKSCQKTHQEFRLCFMQLTLFYIL